MAGAFIEFVRNAEKLGKKKGRLPILSASKFFPFKEERELISVVRNEFERAMNANIELAFNGETFADSLEEMNNNESTLPSTFIEKSRAIANSVDSNARSSFSKQSEMIIGHPYFPPENARQIVETWHSNFLELCKSAETDTKAEISRIVAIGKMQGCNKKQVETAVKERLPAKTKHRAELIARTELGKLNSSVNMETMKSVGVRYYKWLSTLDTRCRASHAVMNNVICSLDDPTVYFEDNPENGAKPIKHNRTASMVKLHPGFDFQCRCSMVMWEPEIDSKYEVKEEPIAEPPQIPQEKSVVKQKLEKAEKRAIKAEKELEVAKKEKSEAERKIKILGFEKRKLFLENNEFQLQKFLHLEKGKPMNFAEANSNKPNAGKSRIGRDSNCQACVVAYEMRRKGYNVTAQPYHESNETLVKLSNDTTYCWLTEEREKPSLKKYNFKNEKDLLVKLSKIIENGCRYFFECVWKKDYCEGEQYGHIVTIEKKDNKIKFYDPQDSELDFRDYLPYIDYNAGVYILRVDNLILNPSLAKDIIYKLE